MMRRRRMMIMGYECEKESSVGRGKGKDTEG
jgi:hypothetical protein